MPTEEELMRDYFRERESNMTDDDYFWACISQVSRFNCITTYQAKSWVIRNMPKLYAAVRKERRRQKQEGTVR